MKSFNKPVVLVHGDSHVFRIDNPSRSSDGSIQFPNFTRVVTFGTPDVHWVRGSVDPSNPTLFLFSPVIVAGNVRDGP
jgi:hypothetical protein